MITWCPECDLAERSITFSREVLSYLLEHNEDIGMTSIVCGHTWSLTEAEKANLRKRLADGVI